MLIVVVLPHIRFFISRLFFYATGTLPWLLRPLKVSTSSDLYPGYFLTFTRLIFTFAYFFVYNLSQFTASLTLLRGLFLPARVFNLTLLSHILTHLWLTLEQNHPAQDLSLYLLSESCPYQVAHDFELFIRKTVVL